MKRIIIIALIVLITNLLVGLIVTAYSPLNLLFTSSAIVINGLLLALLFLGRAESTHRLSLGFIFAAIGALEFVTGFFAPETWSNNWWLIGVVSLTAIQCILLFLAIYYSKEV
jgi:hypothetical protein